MTKILWASNASWVGSGYGKQTSLFTQQAKAHGYEVVVFGTHGHRGPAIGDQHGIKTLPGSMRGDGQDMLIPNIQHQQSDINVILYDLWPYEPEVLQAAPITGWVPIDHDPVPPAVLERLPLLHDIWTMTKWAHRHLSALGIRNRYVPHGVDTDVFHPVDRAEARRALKFDEGTFLAVMVAANRTIPGRKSWDKVFRAWGRFIKRNPNSLLYAHTSPKASGGGYDLEQMARFYGISGHVRFLSHHDWVNGIFHDRLMNQVYNAADVLVMPSRSEGFGVPAIEAQAAGCPVIVSDFGSQAELAGPGYKVPIGEDDVMYSIYNSHYADPRASEIETALNWAHGMRNDPLLREASREFALQYDHRRVWELHMAPALAAQVAQIETRRSRTEARLSLRRKTITTTEENDAQSDSGVGAGATGGADDGERAAETGAATASSAAGHGNLGD